LSNLRVIRKSPTPRDGSVINNRITGLLKLELKVIEPIAVHGRLSSIIPSSSLIKFLNRHSISRIFKYLRSDGSIRKDWLMNLESIFPRYYALRGKRIREFIIIPGSLIKGFARSRLELLAKADNRNNVMSCFILYTWSGHTALPGEKGHIHQQIFPSAKEFRPSCKRSRVCIICDIFGAPGLASRVNFTDLYLSSGDIVISKVCGKKCEVALSNTVFEGWLLFEYLLPEELGLVLLALGIRSLSESREVLLGRYRYNCLQTAVVTFHVKDLEFIDIFSDKDLTSYGINLVNISIKRALTIYNNYFDFDIDEVTLRAEALKKIGKV